MELMSKGKNTAPAVLLLPGDGREPEEVLGALKAMGKPYRLLVPVFDPGEGTEALEEALMRECAGRLWGAYGLGSGADMLLELVARGRIRIRSWVTEGPVSLPEDPIPPASGKGWSWNRAKDKAGAQSLTALRERYADVNSLTLKKLPKKKTTLEHCPKFAAGRMEKTFGRAVCVSRSTTIDMPMDALWARLRDRHLRSEFARLSSRLPVEMDDGEHRLILEGQGDSMELWSHMIRLEPGEDGATVCTDQILMSPRGKKGPSARTLKLYLLWAQLSRSLEVKRSRI